MRDDDVVQLGTEYVATAAAWALEADVEAKNRLFRKNHELQKRLRRSPAGATQILTAMSDPRPGVRLLASTHSLAIDASKALPVLTSLVELPGDIGFSAEWTLKSYDRGKLNLEW